MGYGSHEMTGGMRLHFLSDHCPATATFILINPDQSSTALPGLATR